MNAASAATTGNSVWPWVEPTGGNGVVAPAAAGDWPKISIVTPNHNYGHLIETTIRSVLAQRYPNLEYIVIDDGSTDDSVDVIRRYESQLAHFEQHPNQGQYATINKGFARATGDILGWINSDDVYLPWTLRAVADIFRRFPEVQWVVGHPSHMQDGTVHAVNRFTPYPRDLLRAGFVHGGPGGAGAWVQQESCFWRRSLWEQAGPLRPEHRFAADYELWTRFAERADLHATSTLLGGFTLRRGQNRSVANRDRYFDEIRGVQASIAARADARLRRVIRDVTKYQQVKRIRLVRGAARRLLALEKYRGPVLQWDFDRAAYRVETAPFFR